MTGLILSAGVLSGAIGWPWGLRDHHAKAPMWLLGGAIGCVLCVLIGGALS